MRIVKLNGSLPERMRGAYEEFMGFDSREAQIARLYEPRSIFFFAMKENRIVGSVRTIGKRYLFERLPCEFSRVDYLYTTGYPLAVDPAQRIVIGTEPNCLPVDEACYLRVDRSMGLRERTYILKLICDIVHENWLKGNSRVLVLSCDVNTNLERFYNRFYGFERVGGIRYNQDHYTLMAKWNNPLPLTDPSRERINTYGEEATA